MKITLLISVIVLANSLVNAADLVYDTIEVYKYNVEIIEKPTLHVYKVGGAQVVDASVTLKKDLGTNVRVTLKVTKLNETTNQMEHFAGMENIDVCDHYKKNTLGVKAFLDKANVTVCPLKAGAFSIKEGPVDATNWAWMLSPGKYQVNMDASADKTDILHAKLNGTVGEVAKKQ